MNYEQARHNMIEQQLRTSEVLSAAVVDLLYADQRENYVPDAYRALAFADCAIPLSPTAAMLTPKLEARILQTASLKRSDRVLEIGTGSGHMAALLAEQAQQVWTMEIDPALAERARSNLVNDGVANVMIEVGNGLAGLPAHAPFDFILVSGGVAEIPAALLAQLKVGGRLLAFVGATPVMTLRLVTRETDTAYGSVDLLETDVPMLQDAAPVQMFSF
ncbi:MAG: protein-L-isoaspartate O-methyltransferase [Gammaproteobacteria bacterium]|nr:protein-L-isoaspartate O-methyltransferase [Rhodocyclaceae bacterium]MBU3908138.1 protein-L-isoaspartate O-methyltransferase [Gammaproteobacteria bacterium]MBU3989733.1 protein-L-isoaspartate O-methyltransferase [Gammaproteobacteria bacterium]MBU4005779.1 protein-L-isoaspartate O-methyltransferase [Gammaproteobacteria bacterium]MBU4021473.1 protein-L-isoaspartate O-methyltransferase [Gammaproteobacteria bacterium]